MAVFVRRHPPHIDGCSPAISLKAELGHPLIGPAGDNWLPAGMTERMVIVASFGTGLRLTTRPDADVDGVDRLAGSERLTRHQAPERLVVDAPFGQRRIQTAPTAAVNRLQTEVGGREDR